MEERTITDPYIYENMNFTYNKKKKTIPACHFLPIRLAIYIFGITLCLEG